MSLTLCNYGLLYLVTHRLVDVEHIEVDDGKLRQEGIPNTAACRRVGLQNVSQRFDVMHLR